MGRARAAAGSLAFLVVAPGFFVGLVPWWLTGWHVRYDGDVVRALMLALGLALTAVGVAVLLHGFARFVVEGIGTPAPVAPTERLVVGGLYRYVRNPIYLALAAILLGQALALGQPVLVVYAAAFEAVSFAFVRLYEEPNLQHRFGEEYEGYRRAVPGWWPRRTPWRGES